MVPVLMRMRSGGVGSSNAYVKTSSESDLLPLTLDVLRRGDDLDRYYNFTEPTWNHTCSCKSPPGPPDVAEQCCVRFSQTYHKMGYLLSMSIRRLKLLPISYINYPRLGRIKGLQSPWSNRFPVYPHKDVPRDVDFRTVLMIRNIYDSIISSYLYHSPGASAGSIRWGIRAAPTGGPGAGAASG